jgi:hypothetical protein
MQKFRGQRATNNQPRAGTASCWLFAKPRWLFAKSRLLTCVHTSPYLSRYTFIGFLQTIVTVQSRRKFTGILEAVMVQTNSAFCALAFQQTSVCDRAAALLLPLHTDCSPSSTV